LKSCVTDPDGVCGCTLPSDCVEAAAGLCVFENVVAEITRTCSNQTSATMSVTPLRAVRR
jgi:hypothetical protein